MEILISIDGVLRNIIQKFDYHYRDCYINSEFENEKDFEYGVIEPIYNDSLFNSYKFQSIEEFEYFYYIEYPLEIFGHAGLSYPHVFTELHNLIFNNKDLKFTLVGIDELGKSKPGTLFFLSKNGFLGDNIKFIKYDEIDKLWENYDLWITDNKTIIDKCPKEKNVIKFKTNYNNHFEYKNEINKLSEINLPCLQYTEKITT